MNSARDAIEMKYLEKICAMNDPLQKYQLKEVIGSGGAGKVNRAINLQTDTHVAIKRIFMEKQQFKDIIKEIKGFRNIIFLKIICLEIN